MSRLLVLILSLLSQIIYDHNYENGFCPDKDENVVVAFVREFAAWV